DLNQHLEDKDLQQAEEETVKTLQETAETIREGQVYQLPAEELSETIDDLIDLMQDTSASLAYTSLKSHSDYLAKHCFEVCKLTLHFALVHRDELLRRYDEEQNGPELDAIEFVQKLGLGTILHDIGNWKIPLETLEKPSGLSSVEWEAIEQHPQMGYDILEEIEEIPELARIPALEHHERYDGSGYPEGLQSTKIHLFGRIAAICDVYTALTSERPYRIELTPSRAITIMKSMQKESFAFDPELMELFLDIIPPFPIGQEVILSDGTRGVVCDLEHGFETPTVRVLYEGSEKIEDHYELIANTEDNPTIVN
ncbi:MAG: HD-GYP domain-containing protein, partial [bacterium]